MPTHEATALEIEPSRVGTLELEGAQVPYVNLEDQPFVRSVLRVDETEYRYDRSYPVRGHSAVMPGAITELQAAGRRVLVAERSKRYLLYLA